MQYENGFKDRMVQRMAGTERISANRLSREVGVAQGTLSRWLREASTLGDMGKDKNGRSKSGGRSPRAWSWEEKLEVLAEASRLDDAALGELLRQRGVHEEHLEEWRRAAKEALQPRSSRRTSPEAKRVRALEKEVNRKDRALAEVTALLALRKKVEALWGDADDGTDTRSGT